MSFQSQEGIYNKDNIEILAIALVEDLNKKATKNIAMDHLIQAFSVNREFFFSQWNKYIKYYI